ncbi:hypothetical protein OQA88_2679 [Cercophora sp. LCS_1]
MIRREDLERLRIVLATGPSIENLSWFPEDAGVSLIRHALSNISTSPSEESKARRNEILYLLILAGADVRSADLSLHRAVANRNVEPRVTRLMCQMGADVNHCDPIRGTPIHFAIVKSCSRAVLLTLIFLGADLDAETPVESLTPLTIATKRGRLDLVDWLLDWGSSLYNSDKDPINAALSLGPRASRDTVRLLINHDANLCTLLSRNHPTEISPTAHAIRAKCPPDVIEALLEGGALLDASGDDINPLTVAAAIGYEEGSRALISAGADVNHSSCPVHYATLGEHYGVVRLLRMRGAWLDDVDRTQKYYVRLVQKMRA